MSRVDSEEELRIDRGDPSDEASGDVPVWDGVFTEVQPDEGQPPGRTSPPNWLPATMRKIVAPERAPSRNAVERPAASRQVDAVVIGEPGSGRTSFVASFYQGFVTESPRSEDSCHAGDSASRLAGCVEASLMRGQRFGGCDADAGTSRFELFFGGRRESVKLDLIDGPDGALIVPNSAIGADSRPSPSPGSMNAVRALVLCVDPLAARSDLQAQSALRHWVDRFPKGGGQRLGRRRDRLPVTWLRLGQARLRWVSRRYLPFERVLILATKADLLAAAVQRSFLTLASKSTDPWLRRLSRLTPAELLAELDARRQVLAALGPTGASILGQALAPRTRLAVGLVSAAGFHPSDGNPWLDERGYPRNDDTTRRAATPWRPIGMHSTARFLASGEVEGGLRALFPRDLSGGARARRLELDTE